MVAAFPTMIVEVAFTTAPLSLSPTWTNITSFVEWNDSMSVKRGRTYETEQVQPSTLTLVVNNSDGRFTLGNAAGAYFPNVKPNRRIRVRATWSAVTYNLFDGYVDAWPSQWDNGVWSKATITATDRLKLFSRRKLRSMLEEETINTLDPLAYFPLTESSEATTVSDVSANQQRQAMPRAVGNGQGAITFGSGPALVDELPSAVFSRTAVDNGKTLYSRFTTQTPAGFSVSMWAAFPHESQALWRVNTPSTNVTDATLIYTAVGDLSLGTKERTLRFQMHETQVGARADTPAMTKLTDGRLHHIVVTSENTSGPTWEARVYVDGVLVAGPSIMEATSGTFGSIGEFWFGGSNDLASNATLAHVGLFDYALNTTQIQLLMDGARYYPNDLAGARVGRILSYADVVSPDLDPGTLRLGRQLTTGQTVDAACAQVAATEGGVFFVAADGRPTFHDRDHRSDSINMVTNRSFETDTSGWESPDATLARVTTQKQSGIASLQATITDLTGTPLVRTASPYVTGVVGNRWYHVSAWDRLSTAGSRLVSARPVFLRADNSITLNPTAVYTSSASGAWVQRSSFHQAPADATKLQAVVAYNLSDAVLSDVHQIDTVEVWTPEFVLTADQLEANLQFEGDESLIRNDVTVSRTNGRQFHRADATSVTDHGQLDYSEDVLLTNDRDTSDRLEYILLRYAQPTSRASSVSVDLIKKSAAEQAVLVPALLAADIGQRFLVASLPTGAPAATVPLDIDGVEHSINPDRWVVNLDTSPPPPMFIPRAFFKLDDTVLGKLDAGNFLGA